MKRILSLVMVFAMLLSAVGITTVSAADEPTSEQVIADYPYVYLDFEKESTVPTIVKGHTSNFDAWQEGGAFGSKGSLTATMNKRTPTNPYTSGGYAEWEIFIPKAYLENGATYKFSFNTKIGLESISGFSVSAYAFGYHKDNLNSALGNQPISLTSTPVANDWFQSKGTIVWDYKGGTWPAATTVASVRIRVNGIKNLIDMQPEPEEGEEPFQFPIYVDDIIFEPVSDFVPPPPVVEPKYDNSYLTAFDFEDGSNTKGALSMKTVTATTEEPGTVPEGVDFGEKSGGFTKTDTNQDSDIIIGRMQFNHLYKVSAWVKNLGDARTVSLRYSRTKYHHESTGANTTEIIDQRDLPGYGIPILSNTATNKLKHFYYTGWNQVLAASDGWVHIEEYVRHEAITFDGGKGFVAFLEFKDGSDKKAAVDVLLDNVTIQDLGVVTNGDFESSIAPEQLKRTVINTLYPEEDLAQETHTVFSWYGDGATAEKSTDVRPAQEGEMDSTASMKVTVGETAGGRVYQPVDFRKGKKYNISFWAKGVNASADTTISLNLDRREAAGLVRDNDQDIYEYGDEIEELGDDWTLTNVWQKFTYPLEYAPSFDFVDGKTQGDLQNKVVPRKPYLFFEVNGNAAGTSFLIDDIKVEEVVSETSKRPFPYIRSAVKTSEDLIAGSTASFTYEFVSELDKEENAAGSIMRVLVSKDPFNNSNATTTCYGQSTVTGGAGIVSIPEDTAGKYFKIEILAVDADGTYGEMATIDLGRALNRFELAYTPTWVAMDEGETPGVTVTVNALNNLYEELELVCILAVYSADGRMVSCSAQVVPTGITGAEYDPLYAKTVFCSINGLDGLSESLTATKAKLFFWHGTDAVNLSDVGESFLPAVTFDSTVANTEVILTK